jgi:hypothetical protein
VSCLSIGGTPKDSTFSGNTRKTLVVCRQSDKRGLRASPRSVEPLRYYLQATRLEEREKSALFGDGIHHLQSCRFMYRTRLYARSRRG